MNREGQRTREHSASIAVPNHTTPTIEWRMPANRADANQGQHQRWHEKPH
jgi:hypothetical protein